MFQGLEQLQKVQGEVVEALRDLQQIKKSYHQVAHVAHVAREKAADAQTKSVSSHPCISTLVFNPTPSTYFVLEKFCCIRAVSQE